MNTETNILIALFLGYKKTIGLGYFRGKKIVCINSFKYDSDWNALMEVIEFIENIKIEPQPLPYEPFVSHTDYDVNMYGYKIEIVEQGQFTKEIVEVSCKDKTRLQATYEAVVEFVKWYNLNK